MVRSDDPPEAPPPCPRCAALPVCVRCGAIVGKHYYANVPGEPGTGILCSDCHVAWESDRAKRVAPVVADRPVGDAG